MKKTLLFFSFLLLYGCFSNNAYRIHRYNVFNYTDYYDIRSYKEKSVVAGEKNLSLEISFNMDRKDAVCHPQKDGQEIRISLSPARFLANIKGKTQFNVAQSYILTETGQKLPMKFTRTSEPNYWKNHYEPTFENGRFGNSSVFVFTLPEGCTKEGTLFVIDGLFFNHEKLPPVKFKIL